MSAAALHQLISRARRRTATAAVALCALAGATLPGTASATSPGVISAMNGHTLFVLPSSQWGPEMAMMEAQGVHTLRSDAPWAEVEPNPSTAKNPYDFSQFDAWETQVAKHNLTWLPILDATPGWAKSCPGQCPPYDMQWYAAFAKAVAARYGDGGSFWTDNPGLPYHPAQMFEIWNEENGTQFWSTGPSGAQYAVMYSEARAAIRSVDPQAQVLVGGLGTGDASYFVRDMFTAMPSLHGNVDGFGLHPYEATAGADESDVVSFRETLDALGEGSVPIDLTEFGWTDDGGAQESWRAQMMGQLAQTLSTSNCGVRVLAPYAWVNDPSETPNFGLTSGGALLPSASAWFSGLQSAAQTPTYALCASSAPPPPSGGPPPSGPPPSSAPTPPVSSGSSAPPAASPSPTPSQPPAKSTSRKAPNPRRCVTTRRVKIKVRHGRRTRTRVVKVRRPCNGAKAKPKHRRPTSKRAKPSSRHHKPAKAHRRRGQ